MKLFNLTLLSAVLFANNAIAADYSYSPKLSADAIKLLEKIRLNGPITLGVYSEEFAKRFNLPKEDLVTFDNNSVLAISTEVKYEFLGMRGGLKPLELHTCKFEVYVNNQTSGIKPPFETYGQFDRASYRNFPFTSTYKNAAFNQEDLAYTDKPEELGRMKVLVEASGKPLDKIHGTIGRQGSLESYIKDVYPGIDKFSFDPGCEYLVPDPNLRIFFIKDWNKPYIEETTRKDQTMIIHADNAFIVHFPVKLSEKLKPYIDADKAWVESEHEAFSLQK